MNGFQKRIHLLLLLLLFAGIVPAQAQMTDEQVISYVQQGLNSGKSQTQIGRELLAKGVTQSQIERIKANYQNTQGNNSSFNNQTTLDPNQDRLRNPSEEITPISASMANSVNLQNSSQNPPSNTFPNSAQNTFQNSDQITFQKPFQAPTQPGLQNSFQTPFQTNANQNPWQYSSQYFSQNPFEGLWLEPAPESTIFGHHIFTETALTFEPNENLATPENYKLGPGDEVIIDIWGANEDNVRQRISPDGNIMVSQIGPIFLNGLTIQEANDKIRTIFAQKYADVLGDEPLSDVRVTLGQIRTIQINIMGEVATPGTYRLSPFSSVFHALYKAGGITDIGSLRNIRIIRNGKELAVFDLYPYIFQGHLSKDIRLEEGDVIVVPPYEVLAHISGKVKRPMSYEMKTDETLAALIEYAGGFTGDAYTEEVRVTRATGRERQLFNVRNNEYASYRLEDGDSIAVDTTLERFANRVEIRGSIYRPGMYEIGNRIHTVRELVEGADGLKEDAFLSRVQLFRESEDLTQQVLSINLKGIMDGSAPDVTLQRNDVLIIPNVHELQEQGAFTIAGQVARPGIYPYAENTTIEDLILQAGGLLEGASTVKVDVSRRLKDPKSVAESNQIGETYTFALKDGFVVDGTPGFVLERFDLIEVRPSPGYQVQRQVTLDGEVLFPGGYTLIYKNERISDLVKRAGGITQDAYTRGGRLIRQMNDEERAVRDAALRSAEQNRGSADSVSLSLLQLSDNYSVGIELDKALENPGSDYDVVLRAGDRLVIPEYVSTVKISGSVMYPNTVVYLKDKDLKYYISQAGGYGQRAKRSRAYVIYMNGTVARVKSNVKVEPGCEIIIPSKREREKMSIGEIIGLTTSAASLGTMAASIANLSK